MQQVVNENPPFIDQIDRVFHTKGKPVLYSWGDRIYCPVPMEITPALRAHEAVHGERQMAYSDPDIEDGILAWWMRYIGDPVFRLAEELVAHRAEYRLLYAMPGSEKPIVGWRSRRQYHLHFIATRLASKLYGGLISVSEAKKAIADGCG